MLSVFLPHDVVSWSAVCDCGLSWLYSITFCLVRQTKCLYVFLLPYLVNGIARYVH